MYDLVIFDCDGTLINTAPGIFNSIKYVQKKMNLRELSIDEMKYHLGPPIDESYSHNYGLTGTDLDLAVSYHKEYSLKNGIYESCLYEGVQDLFHTLKDNGVFIAVASMKPIKSLEKIISYHQLLPDFIYGYAPGETKSTMIKKCLLDSHCRNAVMVGDSPSDMSAAIENKIKFISVGYGYGFSVTTSDVSSVKQLKEKLLS